MGRPLFGALLMLLLMLCLLILFPCGREIVRSDTRLTSKTFLCYFNVNVEFKGEL